MRTNLTPEQLFWRHVDPCRTDGCALWIGYCDKKGYGRFGVKGRPVMAYAFLNGAAGKGLEWDHLCRNHACIWPNHLEAVTHQVNLQRGFPGSNNRNVHKTHCVHGHEFTPENTYHPPKRPTQRYCRACLQASGQNWYQTRVAPLKKPHRIPAQFQSAMAPA